MKGYLNDSRKGWLVNKKRRARRDRINTLTNSDVMKLITAIDKAKNYTKYHQDIDKLIRLRDKAVIALGWMFFKRGNELLGVRVGQAEIIFKTKNDKTEEYLVVQFVIQKKKKYRKFCPYCETRSKPTSNAKDANFCRNCGNSLTEVVPVSVGKDSDPIPKSKLLSYLFCKYVVEWLDYVKTKKVDKENFLFPPYKRWLGFRFGHGEEKSENSLYHITVQRLNQILQRLDPTLTSSMFRYGHTTTLLSWFYSLRLERHRRLGVNSDARNICQTKRNHSCNRKVCSRDWREGLKKFPATIFFRSFINFWTRQ